MQDADPIKARGFKQFHRLVEPLSDVQQERERVFRGQVNLEFKEFPLPLLLFPPFPEIQPGLPNGVEPAGGGEGKKLLPGESGIAVDVKRMDADRAEDPGVAAVYLQ